MSKERLDRRGFLARGLAAASAALLGGCEDLSDQTWVKRVLHSAETLTRVTQEVLLSPQALAREFSEADISRNFRANGSTDPDDPTFVAHAKNGFADWKLVVGGLVEEPLELSLVELRAMSSRTQITRHDVSRAGAASVSGRASGSAPCSSVPGSSPMHAISSSIAPMRWGEQGPRPTNIISRSGSPTPFTSRPFSPTR